ncbi:MAG: hydrogenase expression/formation protein HypE [Lachnospiraceae bacterium]|nr:hydrogenase expression/formation protein HypE [Lachnospiraceae bacterium]
MEEKIMMAHGSGGSATGELIDQIFDREFSNSTLDQMEDSAVVAGAGQIAMTTDSFVVTPAEFKGGDIGRLCVCGTVNDLLMRGAVPKYLTCGFILEEGLSIDLLKRVVHSMAETAKEAGVQIVAGDTKVVNGIGELYINTAGVGFVPDGFDIAAGNARVGDSIIVSGNVGDHHAAILSERMNIETDIESDNAPLVDIVKNLLDGGVDVHTLRDVTRGGLATVLKELSGQSKKTFVIGEDKIPVTKKVADFAGLLGLDPLYMGNEGKLVAIVPASDAQKAVDIIRHSKYGENAAMIGEVREDSDGRLIETTELGGERELDILQGEGLPRIC